MTLSSMGRHNRTYTPAGYIAIAPGPYNLLAVDTHVKRDDKARLLNRLNRVEGQGRGIGRMVDEDQYCIDILTQLQAVRAALSRVEGELLRGHLTHCIEGAIVAGDPEDQRRKVSELIDLLGRATR